MPNSVNWSVAIAGEWMVTRPFSMHSESEFQEVRELFKKSDVAYAHLETNGVDGRLVPERHHGAVREYVRRYALADHQRPGGANELLMEQLGLTAFAMDRWGMAGNPADWIERISDLSASGVRRMWLANRGSLPQLRQALRIFGEKVMPGIR